MATNFDFFKARAKHLEWKTKLQSFLKTGTGLTSAQASSEKDCELGKWLYSEGLKHYGALPEMAKLEMAHKSMHAAVRDTIKAKETGDTDGAHAGLEKVNKLSAEVVQLLTTVETKVKNQPAGAAH